MGKMKNKLKLLIEFLIWEIRRIINGLVKMLKEPYFILSIILYIYSLNYFKSTLTAFSFSVSFTLMLYLILEIIKLEWNRFVEHKRKSNIFIY